MLSKVAVVLLVVWVVGVVTGNTFGGLTHALLIVAIVLLILRMGQSQNPLRRG